jgi:hypothetical protein
MKNLFFLLALSWALTSYISESESSFKAGVFSACTCADNQAYKSQIKVSFMADNQFEIIDTRNPSVVATTVGTWEISKKQHIQLFPKNEMNFSDKWKLEKDGTCIKSRKGLNWIRLCNIEQCAN